MFLFFFLNYNSLIVGTVKCHFSQYSHLLQTLICFKLYFLKFCIYIKNKLECLTYRLNFLTEMYLSRTTGGSKIATWKEKLTPKLMCSGKKKKFNLDYIQWKILLFWFNSFCCCCVVLVWLVWAEFVKNPSRSSKPDWFVLQKGWASLLV